MTQRFLLVCLLSLLFIFHGIAQNKANDFASLNKGKLVSGFEATSLYLNDVGRPMGARFVHRGTGFTLDLLQIESVPQAYFWVKTFPISDKGEPHTQEHLLIGKGNKGRNINTTEGMSVASSNAFTAQGHTAYHFYTGAGAQTFYLLFGDYLDALLNPDYTEEEVRREVRNWGVAQNPSDTALRLEEKGSVYNEMTTSMNNPFSLLFDQAGVFLYGKGHPLANNAGGLPSAIREIKPGDIKAFHDQNYHLANMGAIASVPATMPLSQMLQKTDSMLNALQPQPEHRTFLSEASLPAAKPAESGKAAIIPYPSSNAQEPGNMLFAYGPSSSNNPTDYVLFQTFLSVFAGDATTNLYKLLVDSKTRTLNIGAQSVFTSAFSYNGNPFVIGVTGIEASNLTLEKAAQVRQLIVNELKRIAAMPDGSAELRTFNQRFANMLISTQRSLAKFVNTPPQFGFRNTFSSWYDQLELLNRQPQFQKSIVLKPAFDTANRLLASGKNIWRTYLPKWKLTQTEPYVLVGKADPGLIEQDAKERAARSAAEVAQLKKKYNVTGDQEAIRLYQKEYDANTAAQEKLESATTAHFVENPPLTLDDQLVYDIKTLPGGVKLVASTFNNMTSATASIALKLNSVPQDKLFYLAIMPDLLTNTGVIRNGKPVSYEDMSQQVQREILSLQSNYSANGSTGRVELVVTGAGNNAAEAKKAVQWMNLVLQSPNWTSQNLPRIRDLVNQRLNEYRLRMQGPEESWVSDPGSAFLRQNNPLFLSTSSFLTRSYNIFRLRWLLRDAGSTADQKAFTDFITALENAPANRDSLHKMLAAFGEKDSVPATAFETLTNLFTQLPATAKANATEAAKDLAQLLNDLPDESLHDDWIALCRQLKADLLQSPQQTLEELNALRRNLLKQGGARMFVIASKSTQAAIGADVNSLIAGLQKTPFIPVTYSSEKRINSRVKSRTGSTEEPAFAGLLNPNMPTGVFINSAPLAGYKTLDREHILQFLSGQLYAGGGKQSVFSKSIGAGMAYSNGVGLNPGSERISYYAERTPELPQTLRFVIDAVKNAPYDSSLKEYVLALPFNIRSASDYESRGTAMAADLEDGYTPAAVKSFRQALLRLRNDPALLDELYKRKDAVYSRILPGYGAPVKNLNNGEYFVIGSERQLTAYEAYLKTVEGAGTKLYRLYPRDFWLVP